LGPSGSPSGKAVTSTENHSDDRGAEEPRAYPQACSIHQPAAHHSPDAQMAMRGRPIGILKLCVPVASDRVPGQQHKESHGPANPSRILSPLPEPLRPDLAAGLPILLFLAAGLAKELSPLCRCCTPQVLGRRSASLKQPFQDLTIPQCLVEELVEKRVPFSLHHVDRIAHTGGTAVVSSRYSPQRSIATSMS
jgi:hypothetical protein